MISKNAILTYLLIAFNIWGTFGQSLDCSFENTWCGWTVEESFPEWSDTSDVPGIPSPLNGTSYLLFNAAMGGLTGTLLSPEFYLDSVQDLHLGLWMTPYQMNSNFYVEVFFRSVSDIPWTMVRFISSGQYLESAWIDIVISLTPSDQTLYEIRIEGAVDDLTQYIALDYIYIDGAPGPSTKTTSTTAGSTVKPTGRTSEYVTGSTSEPSGSSIDCSFESNLCGWTVEDAVIMWVQSSDTYIVPAPLNGTEFMLLRGPSSGSATDALTSPKFSMTNTQDLHLGLWMTATEGNLNVKVSIKSDTDDEWTLIDLIYSASFADSGWQDLIISLQPGGETLYQIQIMGSADSLDQYIALDYVYLYDVVTFAGGRRF